MRNDIFSLSTFQLTEPITVSAPDTWNSPDNWTGPVPYLYYSFNSDTSLILSNGSEITSDGKVCRSVYIYCHTGIVQ